MVLCTRRCGHMCMTGAVTPPPAPDHLLLRCISEQNQIPTSLPPGHASAHVNNVSVLSLSLKMTPSRSPWISMMRNLIVTSMLPSSWAFRSTYTADYPLLSRHLLPLASLIPYFLFPCTLESCHPGLMWAHPRAQPPVSWVGSPSPGASDTVHSVMGPTFVA